MKRNFDVKVKSTKLESGDWLFGLTLESIFGDDEFHPDFKKSQEHETILDEEQKKLFFQMVYNFLKNHVDQ
jgi:hypothetical protein